jgi:hypothetical protein
MVREGEGFFAKACARFAAALQRLDGADALSDLIQTTRPDQAESLSEVLHRP